MSRRRLDNSASPEDYQYVAVSEEFWDEQRVGALTELCDTVEEMFEILSGSVLGGYAPDGVYDLEARGKIDLEVEPPVISRAKVQGVTVNWPADE